MPNSSGYFTLRREVSRFSMHYAQKAADMGRASSHILAPSIGRGCRAQRGEAHSRLLNIRLPSYRHPERSPRSFLHDGMHHTGASTVTTPWCCLSLLSLASFISLPIGFLDFTRNDDTQKTTSQPLPLERAAERSEAGPTRAFAEIRFPPYRHPEQSPRSFLHSGMHHTGASTQTTP